MSNDLADVAPGFTKTQLAALEAHLRKSTLSAKKLKQLVGELETHPSLERACRVAKVNYVQVKNNLARNPFFAQVVEHARALGRAALDEEARKLCLEGVQTPLVSKGRVVVAWFNKHTGEMVSEDEYEATAPQFRGNFAQRPIMTRRVSPALVTRYMEVHDPEWRQKKGGDINVNAPGGKTAIVINPAKSQEEWVSGPDAALVKGGAPAR